MVNFSCIPVEVVDKIFSLLSTKDILACHYVSKDWYAVASNPGLWQQLVQRNFSALPNAWKADVRGLLESNEHPKQIFKQLERLKRCYVFEYKFEEEEKPLVQLWVSRKAIISQVTGSLLPILTALFSNCFLRKFSVFFRAILTGAVSLTVDIFITNVITIGCICYFLEWSGHLRRQSPKTSAPSDCFAFLFSSPFLWRTRCVSLVV